MFTLTWMGARSPYLDHVFIKPQSKGIVLPTFHGVGSIKLALVTGWEVGTGGCRVGLCGFVYYLVLICLVPRMWGVSWLFEVFWFLYRAFVNGSSYSSRDGHERVDLPTWSSKSLYQLVVFILCFLGYNYLGTCHGNMWIRQIVLWLAWRPWVGVDIHWGHQVHMGSPVTIKLEVCTWQWCMCNGPFKDHICLWFKVANSCANKGVQSGIFTGLECIRWTTLFYHFVRKPLMCGFEHVDNKCSHLSTMLFGSSVQFGFECVVGQKMFFLVVVHVWRVSKFEYLCGLCAGNIMGFPWADWKFWVNVLIWEPFVNASNFVDG